jgi:cytochrome P450
MDPHPPSQDQAAVFRVPRHCAQIAVQGNTPDALRRTQTSATLQTSVAVRSDPFREDIAMTEAARAAPFPPPGPRGLPFVGVALDFLKDPLGYLDAMVARYGRVFRLPLGGTDIIFLNDAHDIEQVLRLDFDKYAMSARQERLLAPLLGHSMPVVADQFYWEQLHAIMLPMFTPKMLQRYFVQTVETVAEEVEALLPYAASGAPLAFYDFVRYGVFTALTRTIFTRGIEPHEIKPLLDLFSASNTYTNARNLSGASPAVLALGPVREGKRALGAIDARVRRLVAERRADRVDDAEDMLDVLINARLADGRPLSDTELRDNVMALLFGGQETTPTAIAWAFALLSEHPEKRQRMEDEVDHVLAGRRPTYADLQKLDYTGWVLDEAMRLYPAFPFIGREAREDVVIAGYDIARGSSLGFVAWTTHRDPAIWPEPERFLPERHNREARAARPKCAYLSFGYGQRRCIGERVGRMEGLLMLAMIAQRFRIDNADARMPLHHVQMSIKPVGPMPVRVAAR